MSALQQLTNPLSEGTGGDTNTSSYRAAERSFT